MANEAILLIQAKLHDNSKNNIKSEINEIQKQLNSKPLEIKININKDILNVLKKFTEQTEKLQKSMTNLGEKTAKNTRLFYDQAGIYTKVTQEIKKNGEIIEHTLKDETKRRQDNNEKIQQEIKEVKNLTDVYSKLNEKKLKPTKIVTTKNAEGESTRLAETFKDHQGIELTRYSAAGKTTSYRVVEDIEKREKALQKQIERMLKFKDTSLNKIDNAIKENVGKSSKESIKNLKELRKEIEKLDVADKSLNAVGLNKLNLKLKDTIKNAKQSRKLTKEEFAVFEGKANTFLNQFADNSVVKHKITEYGELIATIKKANGLEEKRTYTFDRSNAGRLLKLDSKNITVVNNMAKEIEKFKNSSLKNIDAVRTRWSQLIPKNSDALSRLTELENKIKKINPFDGKITNQHLKQSQAEVRKLTNEIKVLGQEQIRINRGLSFGEQFKVALSRTATWAGAMTVFYGTLRQIQKGVQYITDIDTALTNLNKVTDESTETLRSFSIEANRIGRDLAKTTDDVINATTEFARLGYTLDESKILAQQALLYSNVGDIDVNTASQAIISAVKGFGIQVDSEGRNIQKIVDIYNEIGNNYAISSEGIGEALRRSSASLYTAGNTIEEAVAMATAANASIQDTSTVGTALKTISMRIRGISDEGEDLGDLVPKLEEKFNSFGLTMMKDANTFKSTYNIMKDLAGVWGELTDFQRADILELIAGKRQGNVVASMMTNWKDAEDALQSALNSTGSAIEENEKYLQSITAKVEQLKNTLQGFWQTTVNSDTLKNIIVLGTKFIELLTNIQKSGSLLPITIGIIIGSILKFTGVGKSLTANLEILRLQFIKTNYSISATTKYFTGISTMAGLASKSISLLGKALKWLSPFIVITGLSLLVEQIIKVKNANEELKKSQKESFSKANENITNLSKEIKDVSGLYNEYNELNNKLIKTTEEKEKLKDVQNKLVELFPTLAHNLDSEGNAINLNNEQIKEQIKLKEELLKIEQDKLVTLFDVNAKDSQNTIEKNNKNLKEYNNKLIELNKEKEELIKQIENAPNPLNLLGKKEQLNYVTLQIEKYSENKKNAIETNYKEKTSLINSSIALMNYNNNLKNVDGTLKSVIANLFIDTGEISKLPAFFQNTDWINNVVELNNELKNLEENSNNISLEQLSKQFKNIENRYIQLAISSGKSADKAKEFANEQLKTINPINYTKVALYQLNTAFMEVQRGTTNAVGNMISAFSMLSINISKDVASILSNYIDLVAGIETVTDAYNIAGKIGKDFENELRQKESGSFRMTENEIIKRGQSRTIQTLKPLVSLAKQKEELRRLQNSVGSPSGSPAGKTSSSSSSSAQEKSDKYITDQYAKSLAELDKQLELSKYRQSLVTEASAEYRKELSLQIELIKQKQDLAHNEAERLRGLLKTVKQGTKEYDNYDSKINDLQKSWISWQEEINNLNFNRVNSQIKDFDNYLDSLEHKLNLSKTEMDIFSEGSEEYNNKLKEQIDLTHAIIQQLVTKQQYIKLEMQNTALNARQQEELLNVYRQIEKQLLNYRMSLLTQIKFNREKIAEELISAIKRGYETQKELEEAQVNHSLKLAEEAHAKKIKLLDEELKKYNEMIDEILKANDRLWDKDDYEKQLTEEQEKRNKLAQELMLAQTLSLNDPTRDEKIKTATEALNEQDKKISELMQGRNRKLTKQHLQDLKDKKQKEIDATKKTEDNKLELVRKETEEELKSIDYKYENLINNEEYYDDLRRQIVEGSYNHVSNVLSSILNELENKNATTTKRIGASWENVLNSIYAGQKALKNLEKSVDLENEINNEIDNIDKNKMVVVRDYLTQKGITVDWDNNKQMIIVNGKLMSTDGLAFSLNEKGWKTHYGTPAIIDKKLKDIGVYHKGGIIGTDIPNEVSMFNKLVNLKPNEQVVKALIGEVYTPPKNILNNFIPNMKMLVNGLTPQVAVAGTGDTYNNFEVNINGLNGDRNSAKMVADVIINELKKTGGYR